MTRVVRSPLALFTLLLAVASLVLPPPPHSICH